MAVMVDGPHDKNGSEEKRDFVRGFGHWHITLVDPALTDFPSRLSSSCHRRPRHITNTCHRAFFHEANIILGTSEDLGRSIVGSEITTQIF